MFGFFKKMNKKLNNEHVGLIMQCESFLTFVNQIVDGIKENNVEEGLLVEASLKQIKNKLNEILKKKKYGKPLDSDDAYNLLEVNKDCRRLFDSHFNFLGQIQAFDDQFTPVRFKLGMDMDT